MLLYLTGFVDIILEPILWFFTSGIFLILGTFFLYKLIKSEKAARSFFAGIMIFLYGWGIARIAETIRRYYVGYYYDIVDNNFHIFDLDLILRLFYIIFSYTSIACLYYTLENKIFDRRSYFILTISTIFQIIVSTLVYFNISSIFLYLTIILFFVIGLFPIVLFFYFGMIRFVDKRNPWFLLSFGLLLFVAGVALDNPEGYDLVKNLLPSLIIHYGTPILVIIGMLIISAALIYIYRE